MIDWFTVVAQIVNFLILIGLLRYFLYGRILAAMDRRQQEIASRWDEAQRQREDAERERNSARDKNRQLDEQREQLLTEVRDEVEHHRQQLTAKVRRDVDELHERWSDAIHEETESFLRDLRRRATDEVCAIAKRALTDLAGANLEQQILEHFLKRVEGLKDSERHAVIAAFQEGSHIAVVQTAFELTDDQRDTITRALREQFFSALDVQFEQSDDLLCGIALQTNAHTLAWNLRDYLISLEQELQQTLGEETVTKRSRRQDVANLER